MGNVCCPRLLVVRQEKELKVHLIRFNIQSSISKNYACISWDPISNTLGAMMTVCHPREQAERHSKLK